MNKRKKEKEKWKKDKIIERISEKGEKEKWGKAKKINREKMWRKNKKNINHRRAGHEVGKDSMCNTYNLFFACVSHTHTHTPHIHTYTYTTHTHIHTMILWNNYYD